MHAVSQHWLSVEDVPGVGRLSLKGVLGRRLDGPNSNLAQLLDLNGAASLEVLGAAVLSTGFSREHAVTTCRIRLSDHGKSTGAGST